MAVLSVSAAPADGDRPTARKGLLFVIRLLRRAGYAVCGDGGAALLVWTVMNTRPSRQCSRLVTSKAALHTPHQVSPAAPQNVNRMSTSGRTMGERNPIASSLTLIFQRRNVEDLEMYCTLDMKRRWIGVAFLVRQPGGVQQQEEVAGASVR